ncbi:MAG: DegT/DnrJ/EryC1/StrS family aminotransferase [Deltaproteobacteria bacterium]|nr:DegT/DnrJ/EryC1/StrS family aminotransferase [Deltaproteobacteria bacterium]
MSVPLLDLQAQYRDIQGEIDAAVTRVLASQRFILGPEVEACEREVADYCGCAHGVGVSSGTDALLVCLMVEGIGPGCEVVTSPYTFFATAGAIWRLGAKPVFCDIEPETFTIDPEQLEAKITDRTRAIIPVHLFGQCADMEPISEIAERHGLAVIEDAAQAIGAEYEGQRAGSMGDYGCLSFFPSKNLGAAGDGGMVLTQDAERADKLRAFRAHGARHRYHHHVVGGNFRLDALQAAVVRAKLAHLDAWTEARQQNAARYDALFAEAGLAQVQTPARIRGRHVFHQYVVRLPERDRVRSALEAAGIGCAVYYPVPLHLQACFESLGLRAGAMPESERAAEESLALPIYPELGEAQQREVVGVIAKSMGR